jgi:hypothetical protein
MFVWSDFLGYSKQLYKESFDVNSFAKIEFTQVLYNSLKIYNSSINSIWTILFNILYFIHKCLWYSKLWQVKMHFMKS